MINMDAPRHTKLRLLVNKGFTPRMVGRAEAMMRERARKIVDAVAQREIATMFEELFRRLPDIEVSGPPDMLLSAFIHGIERMPCRFTPTRPSA